jgi:hypothetical protein
MASEMYHLITNQVKSDEFATSFNLQSGALSEVCCADGLICCVFCLHQDNARCRCQILRDPS